MNCNFIFQTSRSPEQMNAHQNTDTCKKKTSRLQISNGAFAHIICIIYCNVDIYFRFFAFSVKAIINAESAVDNAAP